MSNYCDICGNKGDFVDFTFDIIKFKKKLFGGIYIECAANDNGETVGFALEIKSGMTGLYGNDINTWHSYLDGIKISFLDNLSENFIKSMIKYYELDLSNLKLNTSSIIECGSLTENPLDFKNKDIKFKCFIDSSNCRKLYAEFYINVDLKNKKVYLNEKSPEYRENIIKYLSKPENKEKTTAAIKNYEEWESNFSNKILPALNINEDIKEADLIAGEIYLFSKDKILNEQIG